MLTGLDSTLTLTKAMKGGLCNDLSVVYSLPLPGRLLKWEVPGYGLF